MTPLPAVSETNAGVTLIYVVLILVHKLSSFFTSLRSAVVGIIVREKPSSEYVMPPVKVYLDDEF